MNDKGYTLKDLISLRKIKKNIKKTARKDFPGQRFQLSESGNTFAEYCIKILENEDYKPDGYAEFMADESLMKIAEEAGQNKRDAALTSLLLIYSVTE